MDCTLKKKIRRRNLIPGGEWENQVGWSDPEIRS